MNTLLKVNKYVYENGHWEIFPTPKNGSCLFSAVRRGLESPEEFRNSHLRLMVVLFICNNADFMFSMLDEHIAGNYGLERMDAAVYQAAKEEGSLTPGQIEIQNTPGPFSFIGYIESLLEDTFWGDHGVMLTISMMWQVAITVLTAEDFEENRLRHNKRLSKADILLIYCGDSHYLGACKYIFILYFRIRISRRWRGDRSANGIISRRTLPTNRLLSNFWLYFCSNCWNP